MYYIEQIQGPYDNNNGGSVACMGQTQWNMRTDIKLLVTTTNLKQARFLYSQVIPMIIRGFRTVITLIIDIILGKRVLSIVGRI